MKKRRERPKRRRAREEAARQRHEREFRAKLRKAVPGWIVCAAGFIASLSVLTWRIRQGLVDSGDNYYGMPVGPVLWSIVGVAISLSFAVAIWQWNFEKGKPKKKQQSPPVDLTSWRKW